MNTTLSQTEVRNLGISRILVVTGKTETDRKRKIDDLCRQDQLPMIDVRRDVKFPDCSILVMTLKHGFERFDFEKLLELAGTTRYPGSVTLRTFNWTNDEPTFGIVDLDL